MEFSYSFDCSNCLGAGAYDAGVTSVLSATQVLTDNIGYLRQDLNLLLELSVFSSIMFSILLVVVLGAVWRQSRY
jgi:ABC-type lipoprotein export system ATPase subunit